MHWPSQPPAPAPKCMPMAGNARPPLLIVRRTIVDLVRPPTYDAAVVYDLLLIFGGAALIALLSQVGIWPNLYGKSINLQSLGVMLVAFLLGRRRGSLAVALYIIEGAFGLPVFPVGQLPFFGEGGGFLAGYLLAAYILGMLSEHKWDRWPWTVGLGMILGYGLIYTMAYLWLTISVGWSEASYVFEVKYLIVGDIIRILFAASLIPLLWWWFDNGGKDRD